MTKNQYPAWATEKQKECIDLYREATNTDVPADQFKSEGGRDAVSIYPRLQAFSTYDRNDLTALIVLAHDKLIKVSVISTGYEKMKILLQPCERHLTLSQAIVNIRKYLEQRKREQHAVKAPDADTELSSPPNGWKCKRVLTEYERVYHYPNGTKYAVIEPDRVWFRVDDQGRHVIIDATGVAHYPRTGWTGYTCHHCPGKPVYSFEQEE